MLAPRERDLKFMVDASFCGPATPAYESAFLSGYGIDRVDPLALAYYRHDWVVEDLAAYGNDVFVRNDIAPFRGRIRSTAGGGCLRRAARSTSHSAPDDRARMGLPGRGFASTVADPNTLQQDCATWPSTSKSKPPSHFPVYGSR